MKIEETEKAYNWWESNPGHLACYLQLSYDNQTIKQPSQSFICTAKLRLKCHSCIPSSHLVCTIRALLGVDQKFQERTNAEWYSLSEYLEYLCRNTENLDVFILKTSKFFLFQEAAQAKLHKPSPHNIYNLFTQSSKLSTGDVVKYREMVRPSVCVSCNCQHTWFNWPSLLLSVTE